MAISSLRLLNFKCFQDSGEIPLSKLTVIFGRNNSGKSSLLQSLLLLRQTLDSPEYGPRLNLRGPLYHAGSYSDLVHGHQSSRRITISLGVPRKGNVEMEFSSGEPEPPRLTRLKISGADVDDLEFRTSRGAGGPYALYIGGQLIGNQEEADFAFPISRLFPLIGDERPAHGPPSERRTRSRSFSRSALRELEETLRDLRMVGPFRRQPERRYEYQGPVADRVDAAGEFVVNALIEDSLRGRKRGKRGKLIASVNKWLRAVANVRLLQFRQLSRSARIYEVRLKDVGSGRWANFADVGFGIGQALPVFVEGLRTPPGGTFMVQEPEIHLHPDAQLRMADFLIDLVRNERQVIAETHSEPFLLRIRRSIVAHHGNGQLRRLAPNDVSIVWVDRTADGTSQARILSVDDLGQIRDWPAGFMEETTQEHLAILEGMAAEEDS